MTEAVKLVNVWAFVQLIFGPGRPMNQLNKTTNIETSYQLSSVHISFFTELDDPCTASG